MLQCAVCSKNQNLMACTACRGIFYCGKDHQKEHWKTHKPTCGKIQEAAKAGVFKETIQAGQEGNKPPTNSAVKVNYVGKFADGRVFDKSEGRGPFEFHIGHGEVIKGWDVGVAQMTVGEKAVLYVSSEFAYGNRGAGNAIPPNSPLIFEVELLSFGPATHSHDHDHDHDHEHEHEHDHDHDHHDHDHEHDHDHDHDHHH